MSSGLFSFIYNTLLSVVNDPSNSNFWLPTKLNEISNPSGPGNLLPIQDTDWSIGNITGPPGVTFQQSIGGQWWLYEGKQLGNPPDMKDHTVIPNPQQPWPNLSMPTVTIDGLNNILVLPNPVVTEPGNGYSAVITLQFDYYTTNNLVPVTLTGTYSLTQSLCSGPAHATTSPTQCDGFVPTTLIDGTGNVSVQITDFFVDATLNIVVNGTGADRTLGVAISKLVLRGPQVGSNPTLNVTNLTINSTLSYLASAIWTPAATNAIQSADGTEGIMSNLNTALNLQANLEQIGQMLTTQLNNVIDNAIGACPAGSLPTDVGQQAPNPADQYLFDRVRYSLNAPSSNFYLPFTIAGFSNPQLDPLTISSVPIPDQTYSGMQITNLAFNNVIITGLSNIMAPAAEMIFQPGAVSATLDISTLNPPPTVTVHGNQVQIPAPPLTLTGSFTMTLEGQATPGGTFTVTVNGATVNATMESSGDSLADMVLTFTTLTLSADNSNITIAVQIDSSFQQMVDLILNQDSVKSQIMSGINSAAAGNLSTISSTATTNVRNYISGQLGA